MPRKNKYISRSKISEFRFRKIIRHFSLDFDAQQIATLTHLNRNSVNRYLRLVLERIAEFCEQELPFHGEIEVDETCFGGKRIKGKRGCGASGKASLFSILQRDGKVYAEVIPNGSQATLKAIIRGKVAPDSVIHSDQWRGCDDLVDLGYKKHYRVQHGSNEFVKGKNHINGIESFWSFAKRRLMKFHRVPQTTFCLHLKECEFRFNYRRENIYMIWCWRYSEKIPCSSQDPK